MEYRKASEKFGSFNSMHEGYAVIKEEVDEMWSEIKKNNPIEAIFEAVQVAAMGLRFLFDAATDVDIEILKEKYLDK